ncbi:BAG family molecular chaperone regulator 3 [Hyalella azteca]|uniref:BAG family molecular chaperone regulator 3 n=1 Tax=Hyalella azteca TaxID=294128 RepID=A0A8B7NV98_HYAAZ|nr:BAG family molecular chaperone regulator 3 [Hyalella azteca]
MMAGRWECFQGLPPGWDAKFDFKTGRYYFIDNTTKQTTWEDPRLKSCPPPPPHPDTIPPEMRAAQTATVAPLDVINFRGSGLPIVPTLPPSGLPSSRDAENEMDVAKISAMFPTVPENRIKELLKKYHQRTTVVISALQVAKYPLATPGPYGTFTPPPARHFLPTAAALAAFHTGSQPQQQTTLGRTATLTSALTSSSISTAGTVVSPLKSSAFSPHSLGSQYGSTQPPATGITSVTTIPVSAAPLSFNSRPSTPERSNIQSRASYERVRGTHLLERIGSLGDQSTMGGSLGSPRLSTRASSPHTTTRSTSEVTRSIISSPRPSQSPRPSPHSPKIKLRYLKGMFPNVDPIIILDVLTQCSYNVKEACESLVSRGYVKKELSMVPPQLKSSVQETPKSSPNPSPLPTRPKFLSEMHNRNIRQRLAEAFPDVTPTVLRMALQSVGHDEELAKAVLKATQDDGKLKTRDKTRASTPGDLRRRAITDGVSVCDSHQHHHQQTPVRSGRAVRPTLPRPRVNFAWTHAIGQPSPGVAMSDMPTDDNGSRALGPDPALHRGPCDDLLLTDYTPWHGPNSENIIGPSKSLARGPNLALRRDQSNSYVPLGPNASLVKGPRPSLAKGSIFSQALKKDSPPSSKRL